MNTTPDSSSASPAADMAASAPAPMTAPSNHILYRTVAATYQPSSYQGSDGHLVTPEPIVSSPVGAVISTMMLVTVSGIIVPSGFALAADPDGSFPIGSIYAPPTP